MIKQIPVLIALLLSACMQAENAAPTAAPLAASLAEPTEDNPQARLAYGKALEQQGNYTAALAYYERMAKARNYEMYAPMGLLYLHGRGVKQDAAKAEELIVHTYSNSPVISAEAIGEWAHLNWLKGNYDFALSMQLRAAYEGDKTAYQRLYDYLAALYPTKELAAASSLAEIADIDQRKKKGTWDLYMVQMANAVDFRDSGAQNLAILWAMVYEKGIGMPPNPVVSQALRLYAQKLQDFSEPMPKSYLPNWWKMLALNDKEQHEAEQLAEAMWAAASEETPTPQQILYQENSKILSMAQQYAQEHTQ